MNFSSTTLRHVALLITFAATAGCANEVVSGPGGDSDGETQIPVEPGEPAEPTEPHQPDECAVWTERACELDYAGYSGTTEGVELCVDWYGPTVWTECVDPMDPCAFVAPGETCNTPLVLVWDGGSVEFSSEQMVSFDLTGLGMSHPSDWPTAATPWLALDRDRDGAIGSGEELFGSATTLRSGGRAANGFDALRELDDNRDGRVDAADPRFAELLVWSDGNGDRVSGAAELSQAAGRLVSIELASRMEKRCDARGNCEGERARFTYLEPSGALRTGAVVDVYLRGR